MTGPQDYKRPEPIADTVKPRVFIGSSMESLQVAEAARDCLADVADVSIWTDGVMELSRTTIESLAGAATAFDFAILIVTPDDHAIIRQGLSKVPRGNVLFEAGLFVGSLGRDRTILLACEGVELPSDFAGVVQARFHPRKRKTALREALIKPMAEIAQRIRSLGVVVARRADHIEKSIEALERIAARVPELEARVASLGGSMERFDNVQAAKPRLLRCLEECVGADEDIRVQWIGMTMFNVWSLLPSLFDDLVRLDPKSVHVEVAMLSQDWLTHHRINDGWTAESVEQIRERIEKDLQQRRARNNAQWTWRIHRYSHMPAVHGCLINGRYLLVGTCRWVGNNLMAGDRPYEFYQVGDSRAGTDQVDVFRGWLAVCTRYAINPDFFHWSTRRP